MLCENLKRPLWIASGSMVGGIHQFAAPVLYHWNWRSLSSGLDMLAFGPDYKDYRKAVALNTEIDNIKRFDRVWMDNAPSNPADPLASDADFYVLSADKGAGDVGEVAFKRLSTDA
jgi:hypothetical protein